MKPLEIVRALYARDPALLHDAADGISPNMSAVVEDSACIEVVQELLALGADLKTRDATGVPLLQALLYPPFPDLNYNDMREFDDVHVAWLIRDKLRLLLAAGADPSVTAYEDVNVLMLIASPESNIDEYADWLTTIERDGDSWCPNYPDSMCSIFIGDILDSILASIDATSATGTEADPVAITDAVDALSGDKGESDSQPSK